MGEVAMEADRRSECADDVEAGKENEIEPVEGDAPEQSHRREKSEGRDDDRNERDRLADAARAWPNGADAQVCPGVVQGLYRLAAMKIAIVGSGISGLGAA